MNFSVIVPSYKDVGIEKLIHNILKSKTGGFELDKVILVAYGYDKLPDFENKVVVIKEKRRSGKAYTINLGIKETRSDIIIIVNGDSLLTRNSISEILKPFNNTKVGMVGGRPVPINDENNIIGFVVNLIWTLHHFVSIESPKLGEIIAFRNIIRKIPKKTAVDEASIELEIKKRGYKIVYAPNSTVYIKGPEVFSDLIKQRKRIFIGHLHLKKTKNYSVSTMNMWLVIKTLIKVSELLLAIARSFLLHRAISRSGSRPSHRHDGYAKKHRSTQAFPTKWIRTVPALSVTE